MKAENIGLANGIQISGDYEIIWDGVNSEGRAVDSGVYFYRLKTEDNSTTTRMMMLK